MNATIEMNLTHFSQSKRDIAFAIVLQYTEHRHLHLRMFFFFFFFLMFPHLSTIEINGIHLVADAVTVATADVRCEWVLSHSVEAVYRRSLKLSNCGRAGFLTLS